MEVLAPVTPEEVAPPLLRAHLIDLGLNRHVCPACGLLCRCTTYVRGDLVIFECAKQRGGCGTRYYIGLGQKPYLLAEPIAEVVV